MQANGRGAMTLRRNVRAKFRRARKIVWSGAVISPAQLCLSRRLCSPLQLTRRESEPGCEQQEARGFRVRAERWSWWRKRRVLLDKGRFQDAAGGCRESCTAPPIQTQRCNDVLVSEQWRRTVRLRPIAAWTCCGLRRKLCRCTPDSRRGG